MPEKGIDNEYSVNVSDSFLENILRALVGCDTKGTNPPCNFMFVEKSVQKKTQVFRI